VRHNHNIFNHREFLQAINVSNVIRPFVSGSPIRLANGSDTSQEHQAWISILLLAEHPAIKRPAHSQSPDCRLLLHALAQPANPPQRRVIHRSAQPWPTFHHLDRRRSSGVEVWRQSGWGQRYRYRLAKSHQPGDHGLSKTAHHQTTPIVTETATMSAITAIAVD